ncbi:MAG: tRNA (cytidine(34)-2'-O)-methyltransferase, partial [Burkholderiales bacterium]|jgi:tRNA (cytidine/uridine-2'-O-)-methyltransferase|nr:tRNA (cytidine(34)-2'-O)-methyltransferase [Burkholderiales bacterium]
MLSIVLVQPEIPPNTGNVIRLAANTGASLHLVEPLGFALEDRALRRAGLDYHEYARARVHPDWSACRAAITEALSGLTPMSRWWALTTKGSGSLFEARFGPHDVLVFGRETAGLPAEILADFPVSARLRIPMRESVRSLNLSNAVAVAVYEAWRQAGFQ